MRPSNRSVQRVNPEPLSSKRRAGLGDRSHADGPRAGPTAVRPRGTAGALQPGRHAATSLPKRSRRPRGIGERAAPRARHRAGRGGDPSRSEAWRGARHHALPPELGTLPALVSAVWHLPLQLPGQTTGHIAREIDGAGNPIGRTYTRPEVRRLLAGFRAVHLQVGSLPVPGLRALPWGRALLTFGARWLGSFRYARGVK
jgi:hypothetical protein